MAEFVGNIGHLEVASPFGNGGGVVKTLEDVERMALTGVGWIEAGSYTLDARDGNYVVRNEAGIIIPGEANRVLYFDEATGAMYNSLGMPNKGMDVVATEIPEMVRIAHAHDKPLIVNVAPVSDDPVTESAELVSRAYEAGADAVLLNAGCPNVITPDGGRHEVLSYKPQVLKAVLRGLQRAVGSHKPVMVRLSPYDNMHTMLAASQALWISGAVNAVFTPNTWGGQQPKDEKGNFALEVNGHIGGKSGPAVADEAAEQTKRMVDYLRDLPDGKKIDVVSSSGIMNARELKRRLDLGAVAGAGTTFFYRSENWQTDVDKLLHEFADAA